MDILKQTKPAAAIALLALACVVLYWSSLQGEFQFDDEHLIRFNFSLRNFADWKGIAASEKFRPLTMLTFAFNYLTGRQNTFAYHFTNVSLHIATVALFFLFLRRFSKGALFAFFSAALFAVHPLNSEAVAYISCRSILLCAVFVLAGLLSFDSYMRTGKLKFAYLFLLFFLLGALAREEAALIPFLALFYNFVFFKKKASALHLISLLAVLIALSYRLLILWRVAGAFPQAFPTYGATEVSVWLRYIWLAIFPVGLNADHDVAPLSIARPEFWLSLLGVGCILYALFKTRHKHQVVFFWGVWFFVNLLPSFFIPLGDAMAEHRVYIAMLGFCACAGYLIPYFETVRQRATRWIPAALCLLIVFYSIATWQRSAIWANSIDLWHDTAKKSPAKARPRVNLAFALFERHAYDDAIQQYRAALLLDPGMMRAYNGLGYCYLYKNQIDAAEKQFAKALTLDPDFIDSKTGMGVVRFQQGRYVDALSYFHQTWIYRQESVELIAMMAMSLVETGRTGEAARLLQERQSIHPRFASIAFALSRDARPPAELRRLTALSASLR